MALTKVSRGLLTTGIVDNSNATAITIDSSENVGIGVVPSAWTYFSPIQAKRSSFAGSDGQTGVGYNWYFDGAYKYIANDYALAYQQNATSGTHSWSTAASGTAGATATLTERMRIDSSGRVGIGTSTITNPYSQTPFTDVNINGTWGGAISFQLGGVTKGWVGQRSSGNEDMVIGATAGQELLFYENNVEAARISGGNLVVGGTSLNAASSVGFTAAGQIRQVFASGVANDSLFGAISGVSNGFQIVQDASNNQSYKFHNGGTSSLTIDSSGNLMVGSSTSAGGARLEVTENSGNLVYFKNSSGTGLYMTAGGTAWVVASDERIKDIIEPISGAMDKISTLRTVIGKYKTDDQGVRRPFLIAQDLQTVFPEVVNEQEDELKTLGVEYSSLVPLLIAGMKEQQATIESQATAITDLTTRLTALENN